MRSILCCLERGKQLTKDELTTLICSRQEEAQFLRDYAVRTARERFGRSIFVRGLIEISSYCKNDCYYCGLRASNTTAERYRLSEAQILECCQQGYSAGIRTFVLQGGEDSYYSDEMIADIVRTIKGSYPDCAVTLSIGEKSYESYNLFREAGADRYLLRHETANEEHYKKLHPEEMSLKNRKQCLYNLKDLGYQVGAGFMVGSPGQTTRNIAEDLCFLKELEPDMVGIGPFIPHCDTAFANEKSGDVNLTLFLLSIIRIMLPKVLLPATTALGTVDPMGREKGIMAGANVVMPNLSPVDNRKKYDLYDNKICTGEEAAECRGCLERRIQSTGYRLVTDRGDKV